MIELSYINLEKKFRNIQDLARKLRNDSTELEEILEEQNTLNESEDCQETNNENNREKSFFQRNLSSIPILRFFYAKKDSENSQNEKKQEIEDIEQYSMKRRNNVQLDAARTFYEIAKRDAERGVDIYLNFDKMRYSDSNEERNRLDNLLGGIPSIKIKVDKYTYDFQFDLKTKPIIKDYEISEEVEFANLRTDVFTDSSNETLSGISASFIEEGIPIIDYTDFKTKISEISRNISRFIETVYRQAFNTDTPPEFSINVEDTREIIKKSLGRLEKNETINSTNFIEYSEGGWPDNLILQGYTPLENITVRKGMLKKTYRARHNASDTECAIKITDLEKLSDKVLDIYGSKRSVIEALNEENRRLQILSRNPHENLAEQYSKPLLSEENYISIEPWYADGETLRGLLEKENRVLAEDAVSIGTQIARGLEHLYNQRMYHGDLKLDNILIDSEGSVKITDYGLCSSLSKDDPDNSFITHAVTWPPECSNGEQPQENSEIWSVGVILYNITMGELPFAEDVDYSPESWSNMSEDEKQNVRDRIHNNAKNSDYVNRVHKKISMNTLPEFAEVLKGCLVGDPEKRKYQSFSELRKDLEEIYLSMQS